MGGPISPGRLPSVTRPIHRYNGVWIIVRTDSCGGVGSPPLLRSITDEDLIRLRTNLGGQTYNTRRTYWATVESVLHWALMTGRMEHDPSIGLPKIKRNIAERMDPDPVPDEDDIWEIAEAGREVLGEWFG